MEEIRNFLSQRPRIPAKSGGDTKLSFSTPAHTGQKWRRYETFFLNARAYRPKVEEIRNFLSQRPRIPAKSGGDTKLSFSTPAHTGQKWRRYETFFLNARAYRPKVEEIRNFLSQRPRIPAKSGGDTKLSFSTPAHTGQKWRRYETFFLNARAYRPKVGEIRNFLSQRSRIPAKSGGDTKLSFSTPAHTGQKWRRYETFFLNARAYRPKVEEIRNFLSQRPRIPAKSGGDKKLSFSTPAHTGQKWGRYDTFFHNARAYRPKVEEIRNFLSQRPRIPAKSGGDTKLSFSTLAHTGQKWRRYETFSLNARAYRPKVEEIRNFLSQRTRIPAKSGGDTKLSFSTLAHTGQKGRRYETFSLNARAYRPKVEEIRNFLSFLNVSRSIGQQREIREPLSKMWGNLFPLNEFVRWAGTKR
ncbi:hypothetical protein [Cohnella caldifontis]|uniref:hypothetical protein n=1 Tax=Cohnella caldifontis TaxID=3027471 RepID=UPI0023EC1FE5|nr:hypothetical protein [Cohnella sp. YIM B05605]